MSLSECIAAWSFPSSTAARICATKAPPLPPCGNSLLTWSASPVVSNLTISTSIPETAAASRRAISSVCASAIVLLRVPIRNRFATRRAPVSPRILQDHVGGLFSDHDGRRVGVARHQVRHDRSVDHAQAFDAANFEALIDHGERIV